MALLIWYQGGAVGPGFFFIIPCIDEIKVIDLRTITFDVPPQEILTKDSVTVKGDFHNFENLNLKVVSCKLTLLFTTTSATRWTPSVRLRTSPVPLSSCRPPPWGNYQALIRHCIIKKLNICPPRNVLGTKTLAETLSERDAIARDLKALIDHATEPWGIDASFVF